MFFSWKLKKYFVYKIDEKREIEQLENTEKNVKPIKEPVFLLVKENILIVERQDDII